MEILLTTAKNQVLHIQHPFSLDENQNFSRFSSKLKERAIEKLSPMKYGVKNNS